MNNESKLNLSNIDLSTLNLPEPEEIEKEIEELEEIRKLINTKAKLNLSDTTDLSTLNLPNLTDMGVDFNYNVKVDNMNLDNIAKRLEELRELKKKVVDELEKTEEVKRHK